MSKGSTKVKPVLAAREPEPPLRATPELPYAAVEAPAPPLALPEALRPAERPERVIKARGHHATLLQINSKRIWAKTRDPSKKGEEL